MYAFVVLNETSLSQEEGYMLPWIYNDRKKKIFQFNVQMNHVPPSPKCSSPSQRIKEFQEC